jgi:Right handed beta helix region/Pectate lyase superfamily protein
MMRCNTLSSMISRPGSVALLVLFVSAAGGLAEIIPANRRADWTLAGVPGGIPTRTNIFVNVLTTTNASYRCYTNGADCSTALYNAIMDCPSNQVVYLPTGTYSLSNRVYCPFKSYFTLRGDGPTNTVIASSVSLAENFLIGNESISTNYVFNMVGTYSAGSSNVAVASLNGQTLTVGTMLWIDQTNDNYLVCATNYDGNVAGYCDRPFSMSAKMPDETIGTRNMQHLARITAIDGTNITFWPPVFYEFTVAKQARAAWVYNPSHLVGFENFTIRNVITNDSTTMQISFLSADRCWVKNVEFANAYAWDLYLQRTVQCEVRECYFHDAAAYTVGRGYGFECHQSTSLLFENNILSHLYMSVMLCNGSDGCVVGYNLITNVINAGGYLIMAIQGSHQTDHAWGSCSHQTCFRNHFTGTDSGMTSNRKPISLDVGSLSNNLVANVLGSAGITWVYAETNADFTEPVIYRLGYPVMGNNDIGKTGATGTPTNAWWARFDSRVADSLLRHGNYDYATLTTSWDASIADHTIPNSLYLTRKPSWWDSSAWPPIGPDLTPMVGTIPAQSRFLGASRGLSSGVLSPPLGLHVIGPGG